MNDEDLARTMNLLHFLGSPSGPDQVLQKFWMALARIKADEAKDPGWERRHHMDTKALALTMAVLHLIQGSQPSRSVVEAEYRRNLVKANQYSSTNAKLRQKFLAAHGTMDICKNKEVKRWLNTREASLYTGIPVSTLRKYRYENRGPIYSKPAGRALYDVADLDAFMASGLRIPSMRTSKERERHVAV